MNLKKNKSRREFISEAGGAAAAVVAAGFSVGCGDQVAGPIITGINPDNLEAVIDGLTTPIQMTRLGGVGTERFFSGSNSQPRDLIDRLVWYEGRGESVKYCGSGEEIEMRFPIAGENTLQLRVFGGVGGRSQDTAQVRIDVLPPALTGNNYEDTQIAFFRAEYENAFVNDVPWKFALYFMDRDSPQVVSKIIPAGGLDMIDIQKVSWEPTSERIAVVQLVSDAQLQPVSNLLTYNTLTDSWETVTSGARMRQPDWSPLGDWIVYATSEERGDLETGDIVFVRPDGSGKFYLSGESPREGYWGHFPTFDPTGRRIAFGGSRDDGSVKIWDDLWGTPYSSELLSYSQIRNFATEMLGRAPSSAFWAITGNEGVDWSPDSEYMVFSMSMHEVADTVEDSFSFRGIARARVDGEGEIELLADGNVRSPQYSPDGNSIFYDSISLDGYSHIFRMSPDGTGKEDLTLASGAPVRTIDQAPTR